MLLGAPRLRRRCNSEGGKKRGLKSASHERTPELYRPFIASHWLIKKVTSNNQLLCKPQESHSSLHQRNSERRKRQALLRDRKLSKPLQTTTGLDFPFTGLPGKSERKLWDMATSRTVERLEKEQQLKGKLQLTAAAGNSNLGRSKSNRLVFRVPAAFLATG